MQSKPIFNKRLYKAKAGISISKQANDVLVRWPSVPRSESDLHAIRSVVSGLKEIHKNFEFVKAALGCALTYEKHASDSRIEKTGEESELSCYYIHSGSIEAFYKVKNTVTQEDGSISYTHVAGDYIGQVSADGPRFDLPPPEFMVTIEQSEFLRIDRQVFHDKIQEAQREFRDEIIRFLDSHEIFEKLSEEDRNKLISQMAKQEFPAGKIILSQGEKQEHAFFIAEGSYFDASCILDDQASRFSVVAVGPVTCYLLNKWTIKNSESLLKALSGNRPSFQSDRKIERIIKESDQWQSYKRDMVCNGVLKDKSSRIITPSCVPLTLRRSIRHGTAFRKRRCQEIAFYQQDELNPRHRKSREHAPSEEKDGVNHTSSVLKAVMLMKRSRGSIQEETEEQKIMEEVKDSMTAKKIGKNSEEVIRRKIKTDYPGGVLLRQKEKKAKSMDKYTKREEKEKREENLKINLTEQSTDSMRSRSAPNLRGDFCEMTPSTRPRVLEDRCVNNERKFIVKEVVNTRIPGKSYPISKTYRRFGPSMFECLDKINSFQKEKLTDPFTAKLTATTWLKKAMLGRSAGQNDYNPGPSPVIVIQEFCEVDGYGDNGEIGNESRGKKQVKDKALVHQKSLDILIEDSDKENMAENADKDEWRTAVHETKYESERCLEKAKEEIKELEQQLVKLGWSRDMLLAKEKRRREERRKHSGKTHDAKTEKKCLEKTGVQIKSGVQHERRKRILKRQDSIQKILEQTSSRSSRRSSAGEKADEKQPRLVKHHSTSSMHSARLSTERGLRVRTLTFS